MYQWLIISISQQFSFEKGLTSSSHGQNRCRDSFWAIKGLFIHKHTIHQTTLCVLCNKMLSRSYPTDQQLELGINGEKWTSLFKTSMPWWPWPWHLFWQSLPVKACPLLFQPFALPVTLIISSASDTGTSDGIVCNPGHFLRMLVSHGGLDVFYQCLAPFEISVLGEGIAAGSRFAAMDDPKRSRRITKKDNASLAGGVAFQEKWGKCITGEPDSAHGLPPALDELTQMCWKSNECGLNKPAQSHKENTAVYCKKQT